MLSRRGRSLNVEGRRPAGGAALLGSLAVIMLVVGTPTPPANAGEPAVLPSFHSNGPPPGHTGGFEEPTCLACHAGFDIGLDGTLEFGDLPETYKRGDVYQITLTLRSTEMERAGFQASVRFSSGDRRGQQAGVLRPLDDRVSVVPSADDPSIHYAQHSRAGMGVIDREWAKWTFEWTAPVGASDTVVFHASANSANGDESPLGDLVYATRRELKAAAFNRR